jgi:hypothetical protein
MRMAPQSVSGHPFGYVCMPSMRPSTDRRISLPEHSIGVTRARLAMRFGFLLLLLPGLCWSSGAVVAEQRGPQHGSKKKFPRQHPDTALLCTVTNKDTRTPDQYYIYKLVIEGINVDMNTVRGVGKPTDGDDLIILNENTAEYTREQRLNKSTLYYRSTATRKVQGPAPVAYPPGTTTFEGPCEALPDGEDLRWPASVMQYRICVAAGGPSNCIPGQYRICTDEMRQSDWCPP